MNTVFLVAFVIGAQFSTPGILLENAGFFDRKGCETYKEESGWYLLRSTFGLDATIEPVPGFVLSCVEHT